MQKPLWLHKPRPEKNKPMNEPQVPPVSILPIGLPRKNIDIKKISEGMSISKTSRTEAKYFPSTSFKSLMGRVRINSIVPLFFSSAKVFMVIAGTRKRNTQGAIIKRVSSVE